MSTAAELLPETGPPAALKPAPAPRTRGFWVLIPTQFPRAFSSYVLRYLLLGIVVGPGSRIDAIPYLGTGKLDLRTLKSKAAELAGAAV